MPKEHPMDNKHHPYKRYDDDFKRNALELLHTSGRPIAEIAGDLGIPYKTLERWNHQMRGLNRKAPKNENQSPPDPRELELKQLRRDLADARLERDILKKALAICSRDPELRNASK
jgi:transposase